MRTALAFIVMICGATGASANLNFPDWWCSEGFDRPAQLVIKWEHAEFRFAEFRFNGEILVLGWDDPAFFAAINYWRDGIQHTDESVIIYRDRVFRPCPPPR